MTGEIREEGIQGAGAPVDYARADWEMGLSMERPHADMPRTLRGEGDAGFLADLAMTWFADLVEFVITPDNDELAAQQARVARDRAASARAQNT